MRNLSLSQLEADNLARGRQDAIYGGSTNTVCMCDNICYAAFCPDSNDLVYTETNEIASQEDPNYSSVKKGESSTILD